MNTQHTSTSTAASSWQRFWRELRFALAALEIGSRTVALADNRELLHDLAARAAKLYPED